MLSGICVFHHSPVGASLLAKKSTITVNLDQRVPLSLRRNAAEQARSYKAWSALLATQLLDADLAHPEFLDLAGHRHRKLLDELEVTRRLEVRDALLAPGLQFLLGRAVTGVEFDPGNNLLAIARARNPDHLHVGHGRVGEEELFQLPWVDILAATDDHVLVAPGNAHITLVIHARQVPGVHPARLVDRFGGAFGVVPVAEHHAVTAGAQFTDGAARHQVARLINDFAFQLRLGTADGGHAQLQVI